MHQPANSRSITVVQATIPRYRQVFLEMLEARAGPLQVLAGQADFDPTVRLDRSAARITFVNNRYLFGRRLLWQRRVPQAALRAEVLVADLNPRVVSTWAVLLLRRALRRPTVLWGHAWPRRGPQARTDAVRHLMRRLATAIVPYTETEAQELRRRMPRALVVAAPNALYPRAARVGSADAEGANASDFVYVGRLVAEKKPGLLLDAFLLALPHLPPETQLVFVGDGPLRESLEAQAARDAGGRVRFIGARSDFEDLRDVFASSLASVIPGYAGLSLIQSLWFGVPALIAKDEPHSPEIEAAVEGENALLFESDSSASLRSALVAVSGEAELWRGRRAEIARECASRYSIDAMVNSFARLLALVTR